MCGKYASSSQPVSEPVAPPPAYTVDTAHRLYDASASQTILAHFPEPIAAELRAKARALSDVVLVHTLTVLISPATKIMEVLHPELEGVHTGILAACDEEITRRYRDGILAMPFVQGPEETVAYMKSPEAQQQIMEFKEMVRRGAATLH